MAVWYGLLIFALWLVAGIGWALGSLRLGLRFEVRQEPYVRHASSGLATSSGQSAQLPSRHVRSREADDTAAAEQLRRILAEHDRQRAALHGGRRGSSAPSATAAR